MSRTGGPSARAGRRDRLGFDRWDWPALAALLGAVALGSCAVLVVQPVLDWWRGGKLGVPYTSLVVVPQLDAVGVEYGAGQYELQLSEPTAAQRVLDLRPASSSWSWSCSRAGWSFA